MSSEKDDLQRAESLSNIPSTEAEEAEAKNNNSGEADNDEEAIAATIGNHELFRKYGIAVVEQMCEYLATIEETKIRQSVQQGFLVNALPKQAPRLPEQFEKIMDDFKRLVLPGVTATQNPYYFSGPPSGASYASVCGDIISNGVSSMSFTWPSNPSGTELELLMLDWLAGLMNLPKYFLSGKHSGGVIQSNSDAIAYMCLAGARNRAVKRYLDDHPDVTIEEAACKLTAYYTDHAYPSVHKQAPIVIGECRKLSTGPSHELDAEYLEACIKEDLDRGMIPCFCVATQGTPAYCAFDNLREIGPICERYGLWLHVDATYAGAAMMCPEHRQLFQGIEYADSFAFSPDQWMLVNFDCSCVWYRNSSYVVEPFYVIPGYLKHEHDDRMPDQHHIRLAHILERYILTDERLQIVNIVRLGLICFRIKDRNNLTRQLYNRLQSDGTVSVLLLQPNNDYGELAIQFQLCNPYSKREHVENSFKTIKRITDGLKSF